ncbi:MAG TPA: hypothetical protein PLH07_03980 [Sulfurovum sp.]|nr:MAG: hypothetical protein B7Y63_07195 [Sulfurovum sp. 35-42-20]OYY57080.1 MAG: hypothetical protein B7Y52_02160 [Sulfurovum sp. 28-43-6]OYZ25482.1 MAG: hypothetical protein B7Y23_05255 [Sulfurovum sp. 16-42-52]OZA44646.1 MAG: hypothetical protein B7X80_07340 [Sulfurovum sp. 17-42-90]OZA59338.1 MAG: hypothetical protein B7X69_08405 [Sulfurovum sp. 39-42-12]HQR73582.1 hypothetical protein [Sulfurovum sp.]
MMDAYHFYEDIFIFMVLQLMVFGVYALLALHYVVAFRLMKNTASYEKYKSKIEKAKTYVFLVLKFALWVGWLSVALFYGYSLYEGWSLATLFFEYWAKIPEGFWLEALFVIVRIAVVITLSRYFLKWVYGLLDRRQQSALENRCVTCTEQTISRFYRRLHTTVKYTVVLGILYRICSFFPFLEMLSAALWMAMLLYLCASIGLLGVNILAMLKEKKQQRFG